MMIRTSMHNLIYFKSNTTVNSVLFLQNVSFFIVEKQDEKERKESLKEIPVHHQMEMHHPKRNLLKLI